MPSHWRNQWSIGVFTGPALDRLTNVDPAGHAAITWKAVTDVPARAVADPFLLRVDGRWHLFFEVWNTAVDRGEIAHATSVDARHWQYEQVVLREPFHLSYPHVFADGGTVWMIPESRQDDAVHLYAAERFPDRWRRVRTLLRGPFADATPVHHDGRWWIFALRGLDELRLYSAPSLEGPWSEHPHSPFWPGNRSCTRPGGRILRSGSGLIRFAQEGWPTYGFSLRAFEITELSTNGYAERELPGSPILRASRQGWNAAAMHHIDAVAQPDGSWLAIVDGATAAMF